MGRLSTINNTLGRQKNLRGLAYGTVRNTYRKIVINRQQH